VEWRLIPRMCQGHAREARRIALCRDDFSTGNEHSVNCSIAADPDRWIFAACHVGLVFPKSS
jgi:hypothetical protein